MTPSFVCSHRCTFCWRDIEFTPTKWDFPVDDPKIIVDGCIKKHIEYLKGFGGNPKTDKKRYEESLKPLHFAISLSSEPTFYPKLPGLIKEIKSRNYTSFLVSNGTNPKMLERLIKQQPTQLYITLPAPNEKMYEKVCNPLIKDGWQRLQKSLKLLKCFDRGTVRLTLYNGLNMKNPKEYSNLLKDVDFKFLEVKAAFPVGYARYRLKYEDMPRHGEIKDFANEIKENLNLEFIDEKENSRVVLLAKEDKTRFLE